MAETPLVTTIDAASILDLTPQHVRRLIKSGTIVGEKLGRDWLVDAESLERFRELRSSPRLPLVESEADDATAPWNIPRHDFAGDDFPLVSLFCGCGGMDLGFEQAGFRPVLAVDVDSACIETYRSNHDDDLAPFVIQQDLADVAKGAILKHLRDAGAEESPVGVIGGPPCQAFSTSNVYKTDDDPRAKLPLSYATILKDLNDEFAIDFFVFENVIGLRNRQHAEQFMGFKKLFATAGFDIHEIELDAYDFGVPQERKRVFVIGFNKDKYENLDSFEVPLPAAPRRTVADAIWGMSEPVRFRRDLTEKDFDGLHPNHWCMMPRSKKFENNFLQEGEMKGRAFRVLSWDAPSWTVAYGHREVHVHPEGKRRLSIHEAMRLQGFPDWYELRGTLSDQIRLVSDAVSPPVAKAIGEAIREVLRRP